MYRQYQALKKRQQRNYQKDLKFNGSINKLTVKDQLKYLQLLTITFSSLVTIYSLLMIHHQLDNYLTGLLLIILISNLTIRKKPYLANITVITIWLVNLFQLTSVLNTDQVYNLGLVSTSFGITTITLLKMLQLALSNRKRSK